jgi:hypothetical protein
VLIVVAVRFWSPVVVLGAAVLSLGGAALAPAIGAWGVRRGFWAYGAVLAGWAVAALWFVVVAHLVPGGTGGCFE